MNQSEKWIALIIGNSRLHWAVFSRGQLQFAWDTPHFSPEPHQRLIQQLTDLTPHDLPLTDSNFELWIASVVPAQTQLWQQQPNGHLLTLDSIPLKGMYPTFGIDRALALWGAIQTMGSPVLVIDAGTALTFTAATEDRLVGGAILPGLQLQFRALSQATAALPFLTTPHPQDPIPLPDRWSLNTESAIASGIIHTLLAGIQSFVEDWWQQYPDSAVVITGGDSKLLHRHLQQRSPNLAAKITPNPHVIFAGIRAVKLIGGRGDRESREDEGCGEDGESEGDGEGAIVDRL